MKKIFMFLFLLTFLFSTIQSTIKALSNEDIKSIDENTVWFKPLTGSSCSNRAAGEAVTYSSSLDESNLTTSISDYMSKTRPDSPLIPFSADFVTYGKQYNVNPAFVVSLAQKETSLGTAGYAKPPQYNVFNVRGNGPGGFGNYTGYQDSIKSVNELLAGSLYLGSPSNFTTVEEIMNRYAPPVENNTTDYIEFVVQVMQKILGTADANSILACNDNGAGTVSEAGYSFPLAPQKKDPISAGDNYPLPCTATSCHRDNTSAFDLAWKPLDEGTVGAAVYAISDGVLDDVNIYRGIDGCYALQLHSNKDNYWYYYAHLRNPVFKTGDVVKAGQKIAEVGERKCTYNNSYPHLHIDRGCVVNEIPQKGGRVECRDPGITPLINTLWDELPV